MGKNIIRTEQECTKILLDVQRASSLAARLYMSTNADTGTCGFATVTIPKEEYSLRRDPRSPFPRRLTYRGQVPGMSVRCGSYQSIDAHEAVAAAVVEALRSNGVNAHYSSRMD